MTGVILCQGVDLLSRVIYFYSENAKIGVNILFNVNFRKTEKLFFENYDFY